MEFKESGQKTNIIFQAEDSDPGKRTKHFIYDTGQISLGFFKIERGGGFEAINLLCVLDSELEAMVNFLSVIRTTKK